jgi:hypothetical protein
VTTSEKFKAKLAKPVERAVIDDKLKNKLEGLKEQANASLQGIATVTKSDIVNLILAAHPDELSLTEISQLKSLHLDQVKYALWIAKKLREARNAGEVLSLQDVLAMSQQVVCDEARAPRIKRARKKKDISTALMDVVRSEEAE